MNYLIGKNYYQQFVTFNISGISANMDSVPWATMVHNGVDDFSSHVFVNNVDIGRYTVSGIISNNYAVGDSVGLAISGNAAGNLTKYYLGLGTLDSAYISASILASGGFDHVMVEPGVNARQHMAIDGAALAGISSGAGNTVWYQGVNNPNQNRISAVATSGIRTVINYVIPS